jgi:uncharacterized protein
MERKMKQSTFNITTKNPDNGETVIFNTLYGSTVAIDAETLPIVASLLGNPSPKTKKELELFESLRKLRFIIDDEVDELEIVENRKRCGMKDKNRADVIIMPNLDCNFACPYCYEKHDHSNRMSSEVEESIKIWIESIIDSHKVLLLNWFGGEPLLSYKTVLSIGKYVRQKCKEKGVSLLTNITTNGYAFTNSMISEFVGLEMFSYQITIDGPPDIHNKTRILKSGKGSFDKIMDNIVFLAEANDKVKISLRVNYNHNNIHHIPELLSMFPAGIRKQLRIVYEPIFGNNDLSATSNLSGADISEAITEYYELANSMGFDVVLGGLGIGKLVYCYAERENQYILNYNGEVFKCSVTDFDSSKRVGFVNRRGEFIKESDKWNFWFDIELFEEKCKSCVFLPLCMGGCRKDRIENKATGSYCNLVPTNTSHALKSIAFGSFNEILKREVEISRKCAKETRSPA